MSTNSYIGIYNSKTNTTRSIYVHWDGHPDTRIPLLNKSFKNRRKVKALIELGDISALYPKISKPKTHSFNTPVKGYTVFYGRDRGETGIEAKTTMGRKLQSTDRYNYLYMNNRWHFLYKNVWHDVSEFTNSQDFYEKLSLI